MAQHKILIAEDDAILREILMAKFMTAGITTLGAETGTEAMKIIESEHPDLVLMDIQLPGRSGLEIMADMKQKPDLAKIPVIAISNSDDAESIKKTRELGVKDFLIKAIFDSSDVLEKVQRVLQGSTATPTSGVIEHTTATVMPSAPGGATEIELTIPKDIPAPTINNLNNNMTEPTVNVSMPSGVQKPIIMTTPPTPTGPKKTVLIVEDDKFLRDLAASKVESEGYNVATAEDGSKALEYLKTGTKPSVIVLDLILPGITGYQVLEEIKKDETLKNIPVLVLSNLGQEEDIDKAKKLGAMDYLVKAHFSFGDILKKIKEIAG